MSTNERRAELRTVLIQNLSTLASLQLEEYREVTKQFIEEMAPAPPAVEKPVRKRRVKEQTT